MNEFDHKPKTLSPLEAFELLRNEPRSLLIDVRSSMEYLMIGHPVGAIHIPWLDEPDWTPNPRFVTQVRELLLGGAACPDDDAPALILICRSGRRSAEAGAVLLAAGLRRVFNVQDGFEGPLDANHHRSTLGGWRFAGLPWEQC